MSTRVQGATSGVFLTWAGLATAQPIETMTYDVVWDLAQIEPGQTNKGQVLVTIFPDIGSKVAWNTAPGTGQPATLMAIAISFFDLLGEGLAGTGTLEWTVPSDVNAYNTPGVAGPNGGITGVKTGQTCCANPFPNTKQVVTLLDLAWTAPMDGPLGQVAYTTSVSQGKVYIDVGLAAWVGETCVLNNGDGGFLVVPAPGIATLVGAASLGAWQRKRTRSIP